MRGQPGRAELGQNFLVDPSVVARIVDLARCRPGPLVEWGTGDGAITLELSSLRRRLEGVEIDPRRVRQLRRRVGPHVCINEGDILRHAPPFGAVVVCNVPFHVTTPVLRHLFATTGWSSAILVTQWEVARKRAGVGGATQLTAQWWPWFEFALDRRVPATAFRPRPSVDAGLLVIDRRVTPLLPMAPQRAYQAWVSRVFRSKGRGLVAVLTRNGVPHAVARGLASDVSRRDPLPRDLTADAWVRAFEARPSLRT